MLCGDPAQVAALHCGDPVQVAALDLEHGGGVGTHHAAGWTSSSPFERTHLSAMLLSLPAAR